MYKIIRPTRDATIFDYDEDLNTGIDEVIELNTVEDQPSRVLMDFDFSEVQESLEDSGIDYDVWLRLFFANGQGMPTKYVIEAYEVTTPWKMGRGRTNSVPQNEDGATWQNASFGNPWTTEGGDFGTFNSASETFNFSDPDVFMDVTLLFSGSPEEGILLKRKTESGFNRTTELKFFGRETHTVFVPHLLYGFDDHTFEPMGAMPLAAENLRVYVSNLRTTYTSSGKKRFRVYADEKYNRKPFLGVKPGEAIDDPPRYLPEGSLLYEIRDRRTGLAVMPFHQEYTQLSFDPEGYFFDLELGGLFPQREYDVLFKYVDPDAGTETVYDNNQSFEIIQ
jgi:hypothetical protein